MKRKIFVVLILGILGISSIYAQTYTTKMESIFTDSESTSSRLQHVKSAIDSKGNLHVVFLAYENHTYYGTNQSGAWKFEKLQYFDTHYKENYDVLKLPNIVADKNDIIHFVSFDRDGEKIVYGKKPFNTGEFKLKTVEISPEPLRLYVYGASGLEYTDLAIDKNGGLHFICKTDYTTQSEVKFSQCATYFNKPANSEKWLIDILMYDKQFSERYWSYGTNSSIVCNKEKVYVALGGSNELHLATRNISGGKWQIERLLLTPDEFINSGKDMISMAVSPNGSLKFAFYDRTDDENSLWHGITIFSQSTCGNKDWRGIKFFDNPKAKNVPAVAFDNNGKFYLAMARNSFTLWHQACDCNGEYIKIFENKDNKGDFSDMVIDEKNTVFALFTSSHDNKLYLLTAKPNGTIKECNYPPIITGYTGQTNVKPGKEWVGTVKASDPECDKIDFYTIIKSDNFTVTDHGNGTATIKAKFPEGNGTGDPTITLWVRDSKHRDVDNKLSAITFKLRLTPEGKEKGSIKVENKCTGSNYGVEVKEGESNSPEKESNGKENQVKDKDETGDVNSGTGGNADCDKFIGRYEKFADEYVPIIKKVKANPTDMDAVNKLSELMQEFESYSSEWVNLYDCHKIPGYQKRYDAATKKIQDANK